MLKSHFKIIRMTTTLQTIKYNLRPKFLCINWREFSYQTTNTNIQTKIRNGSSFLVKFLERNGNQIPNGNKTVKSLKHDFSSCSHGRRLPEKTLTSVKKNNVDEFPNEKEFLPITSIRSQNSLHSYDPVYAVVKPFTPTADDILVLQDEPLIENNIISRNNYSVTVLSNLYTNPPALLDASFTYTPLTDFEKSMIHMAGKFDDVQCKANVSRGRPKPEHLEHIYNVLSNGLPRFFTQAHDYSIYTEDIEFNNNIRGITTRGIASYVQQLALVRIVGHFKFAHVRLDVLKITKHPDDGTIRVRWRIRGITAITILTKIWKVKFREWRKLLDEESDWYDGFSIFYIGEKGTVYRHDCDKMIPDEEKKVDSTQTLAAKLALLLGVLHRPALDDLNTVMMALLKMQGMDSTNQHAVK